MHVPVCVTPQDLIADLCSELSGHLEEVVLGLMMTPPEYDASAVYNAIKVSRTALCVCVCVCVCVRACVRACVRVCERFFYCDMQIRCFYITALDHRKSATTNISALTINQC